MKTKPVYGKENLLFIKRHEIIYTKIHSVIREYNSAYIIPSSLSFDIFFFFKKCINAYSYVIYSSRFKNKRKPYILLYLIRSNHCEYAM